MRAGSQNLISRSNKRVAERKTAGHAAKRTDAASRSLLGLENRQISTCAEYVARKKRSPQGESASGRVGAIPSVLIKLGPVDEGLEPEADHAKEAADHVPGLQGR